MGIGVCFKFDSVQSKDFTMCVFGEMPKNITKNDENLPCILFSLYKYYFSVIYCLSD